MNVCTLFKMWAPSLTLNSLLQLDIQQSDKRDTYLECTSEGIENYTLGKAQSFKPNPKHIKWTLQCTGPGDPLGEATAFLLLICVGVRTLEKSVVWL